MHHIVDRDASAARASRARARLFSSRPRKAFVGLSLVVVGDIVRDVTIFGVVVTFKYLSGSSLSRNAWAIPIVRRSHTAHSGSPSKATFAMRLYGDRIDVCTANRLDKSPLIKQCNP